MGKEKFGDCLLCLVGGKAILIDGGHPGDFDGQLGTASLPDQIGAILGTEPPYAIDLLVVTHAHLTVKLRDTGRGVLCAYRSGTLSWHHEMTSDVVGLRVDPTGHIGYALSYGQGQLYTFTLNGTLLSCAELKRSPGLALCVNSSAGVVLAGSGFGGFHAFRRDALLRVAAPRNEPRPTWRVDAQMRGGLASVRWTV